MKIKKLVSAVSAFAMTVSAFAGMTVAKAATNLYSENFEDGTVGSWTSVSGGISVAADSATVNQNSSQYILKNGGASGSRTAGVYLESAKTTGMYKVAFDVRIDATNNDVESTLRITGAKETKNWFQSTDSDIFRLAQVTSNVNTLNSSTYTVNSATDVTTALATATSKSEGSFRETSGWLNVVVVVDMDNKTENYKITRKSTGNLLAEGNAEFSTSKFLGIETVAGKGYGGIYMDNITIDELVVPAFTLSKSELELSTDGTDTVEVTGIVGSISVDTSKSDIADVSYADGVITITGKSEGVTKVTVTATNDGLTTSKSIDVTVGNVEAADAIVNYVDENGTVISSDTTTYAAMTVGKTISEISYDDVIYGENCKYVNPVVTGLPLTVQSYDSETEENPNVITVTYERKEPVTSLTINYVYNEKVVATKTKTITDGYADDKFEFVDVFYLTGTDGVVYKTGKELYTTVANNSNTTATTDYNRTAILGTTLTIPVTVAENAVYFVEGEDLGVGSATFDSTRTYMTASGNAVSGIGNKNTSLNVYTAPETAQYQIVIANYSRNRNSLLKLNDETIATIGNSNNGYRGQYSVIDVVMTKDSVLSYSASGSSALTEVDYILIRKTGEVTTPATATYSFVNDYTTETGDTSVDNASLFKLVVKAGTNAISSLNVKVNGTAAETAPEITTISGETEAVFAVVVNALSEQVKSITAVINGDDVAATAAE